MTGVFVIAVVVVLVAVALWMAWAGAWVPVDERGVLSAEAELLDGPMRRLLASVPGSRLLDSGRGSFTLVLRRRPFWALVGMLLTLPIGLLFLLVRDTGALQVTLTAMGGQTELRLVGRTKRSVLRLFDDALAPVVEKSRTGPDAALTSR